MSRSTGNAAEEKAAAYLAAQGYRILARNYTIRGAEIDLIAEAEGTIAFVEVKYRKTTQNMLPREAVTHQKRRRISMGALQWLQTQNLPDARVRFDVVEVTPQGVTHLPAAFDYTP